MPISANAYKALSIIIRDVPKRKINPIVDGYTGFLFVNKNGDAITPNGTSANFRNIIKAYNKKADEDKKLPSITPHTFRHTFCTRLVLSGMDVKSVQYIMGHRTLNTTLSIYTHIKELNALEEFDKRINKASDETG